jgi:hypothetical protein
MAWRALPSLAALAGWLKKESVCVAEHSGRHGGNFRVFMPIGPVFFF